MFSMSFQDWHLKKSNSICILSFIFSTCTMHFVKAKTNAEFKQQITCAHLNPNFAWEISNDQIYNRCYAWSAQHSHSKLKNWQYSQAKSDFNNPAIVNSVHVTYQSSVAVPTFFQSYINNDKAWQISVVKDISLTNNRRMTEITQIDNLPIVSSMTMHSTYAVRHNRVSAHITYDLDIPWYLYPVQSLIKTHVSKSIGEYATIVLDSACSSKSAM
jgi:hypothetical protein